MSLIKTYLHSLQSQTKMNYTLKQLQDRVNSMIKEQGEDAECAAWIYTKNDCHLKDEDGNVDYDNNVEDPLVLERIFYQVCLLYTSPSPRDGLLSRMPSSA